MRRMLWRLALAVLIGGMGVRPAQAGVQPAEETPVYLPFLARDAGVFTAGVYLPLVDITKWPAEAEAFRTLTGKQHGLFLISSGFKCFWVASVSQFRFQLNYINGAGAMPLITWMPSDCGQGGFGDISQIGLPEILSGAWDAYIQQWATDIAALGYPVMVRWGHEMNIPSYSWAGQHAFGLDGKTEWNAVPADACGSLPLTGCYGDPTVADGPERYVAAYRHVHTLADAIAPNILWVWIPNALEYPFAAEAPWNSAPNYYPGDSYVDWVGVDAYNWGAHSGNGGTPYSWDSFDDLFGAALNDFTARYPAKPQMIPEFASVEDPGDSTRKASWLLDAYQRAKTYPLLRAVVYVHDSLFVDVFHVGGPTPATFQVNSSAAALEAYKQAVAGWSGQPPRP